MPEVEISDVSAATIATVAIALLTLGLFVLQWIQHKHDRRVSRANYKLSLFEKRLSVFEDVEKYMGEFLIHGRPSVNEVVKLRSKMRNAVFLFPPPPLQYVKEIEDKTFEYHRNQIVHEPLRDRAYRGEKLTAEETSRKVTAYSNMANIIDWFGKQVGDQRLRKEFEPYLSLPDTV